MSASMPCWVRCRYWATCSTWPGRPIGATSRCCSIISTPSGGHGMVGAASRWSMPIRRQAAGRSELARRRSPQLVSARQSARRAPNGTLTLHFQPHTGLAHVDAPLPQNISAVAVVGRTLFAACDETATVERLVRASDGDYHQQDSIALGDHFELPEGSAGEMDIEGLAIDGDVLWIAGSHSLKRDKPDLA